MAKTRSSTFKKFNDWLLTWKPIPLCWWFEKHGRPIPKYFIGGSSSPPSVTTSTATNIGVTSATGNGNVTSDGGATISERGFVVSATATNSNPTIGGTGVTKIVVSGTTGAYSGTLTPLTAGTGYSYKAYATNSKGTSYGSVSTFTTKGRITITKSMAYAIDMGSPPTVVINTPSNGGTVSSLTPTLEFTGTDPEGDPIHYQLDVATANTFGADTIASADSSVSATNFANTVTPADTAPFNSGEKADYDLTLPGYGYKMPVTLNSGTSMGTTADISDYIFLYSETNANLKTVANGGHVESSSGFDIVFYDENGDKIPHEIVFYDGSTGQFKAFVKIPTYYYATSTSLSIHYGNANISATQEDKTNLWSDYVAVFHMSEDPSGTAPQVKDSTGSYDLTSAGSMTTGDLVTGPIHNAIEFDGSDDGLVSTAWNSLISGNESRYMSLWFSETSFSDGTFMGWGADASNQLSSIGVYSTGFGYMGYANDGVVGTTTNYDNGDYKYISISHNGTNMYGFAFNRDGTSTSDSYSGAKTLATPTGADLYVGRRAGGGYSSIKIAEVRVADTALDTSGNRSKAEYYNYSNPSGFYSSGTEASISTYYLRVRGLDPTGSNTWGSYSTTHSFTVSTGSGSVSITKSLSYKVRTSTPITKSLAYKIRTTQTAITKSLTYEVRFQNAPITKGMEYKVLSTATTTKGLNYEILTTATTTKGFSYTIVQQTAIQKTLAYKIRSNATITKGLDYKVKTNTSTTKGLEYEIQSGVAITKSLSYEIATSVTVQKGQDYEILTSVNTQKSLSYAVVSEASPITKGMSYEIRTSSAITKSLSYEIKTQTHVTKGLTYAVVSQTGPITKGLDYKIKTTPSASKDLDYQVKTSTSQTKDLDYEIRSQSGPITKGLLYAIRSTSATTKSLEYQVRTSQTINKGLVYGIQGGNEPITVSLEYKIKTKTTLQSGMSYEIATVATIQKGLEYQVTSSVSAQKDLDYQIKTTQTVQKGLDYEIRSQSQPITKAIEYKVRTSKQITKGLNYAIQVSEVIQKNLDYEVRSQSDHIVKGLQYKILITEQITKGLDYSVTASQQIQKDMVYAIATLTIPININLAMNYEILTSNNIQKGLKYEIATSATIQKGLEYEIQVEKDAIVKDLVYQVTNNKVKTVPMRYNIKTSLVMRVWKNDQWNEVDIIFFKF